MVLLGRALEGAAALAGAMAVTACRTAMPRPARYDGRSRATRMREQFENQKHTFLRGIAAK